MGWNLTERLARVSAGKTWDGMLLDLSAMVPQSPERARLYGRLWSLAYAQHALDTSDAEALARLDQIERDYGDGEEEAAGASDVERSEIEAAWSQLCMPVLDQRYEGMTFFHARTHADARIRRGASEALDRLLFVRAQRFADLLWRSVRLDAQLGIDEQLAARLAAAEAWIGARSAQWEQIAAEAVGDLERAAVFSDYTTLPGPNELERVAASEVLARLSKLLDAFGGGASRMYATLIGSGALDYEGVPERRMQAAFSLPIPGDMPLCFLHSVEGREGALGLVHEIGHGIHFVSYAATPNAHLLPSPEHVEVFPLFLELLALQAWEGVKARNQRIFLNTAMQRLSLVFRRRVLERGARRAPDVAEAWHDACSEVLGASYRRDRIDDWAWCLRRTVWISYSAAASYPIGGVLAARLALAASTPVSALDVALGCDPLKAQSAWDLVMEMAGD